MKRNRLIWILISAFVLAALSACGKKALTYEEARPLFKTGMSMQDVAAIYGETGTKVQLGEYMSWSYTPIERLKPPLTEIHGFTVFFKDGLTHHMDMSTTIVQ